MAGKAKERKTFGNKLKDQQEQNKTLYSLASQELSHKVKVVQSFQVQVQVLVVGFSKFLKLT